MSDSRKKILLVHSTLHIGGAEEVSANICRRIDRTRFDISVCFLKEKGLVAERIESEGTVVHAVGDETRNRPDYLTWWKLRRLLVREKIDLIHSHDVHSLLDGSLCKLSMPKLKLVHTYHFGGYPDRAAEFRRLERIAWRMPDKLVAVSENQRRGIRSLYGMGEDRISTVWNGVDVLPSKPPHQSIAEYRKQGRVIIGCVNTLIEQKGMPDLIKVARRLKESSCPPFVFLIVGGGHMLEGLRKGVIDAGLENEVVFLDWMTEASQSFIPYIDIFFQPSLWEAMSIVLLESMALGRAIVATAVGETPRIIDDGVHGHVVASGDIGAMTDALRGLLVSPETRAKLGKAAQDHYNEQFTATRLAERHEELYEDLCS